MEGEGVPNVSPALKGHSIIAMECPRDTIAVVLNGIPTERFTGYKRMYEMPPFSHRLKDEEVADLVTWVRAEWGEIGRASCRERVEVEGVARSLQRIVKNLRTKNICE